ncbi:MAG: DUF2779 domain-containing protein [Planctomycetes bacterium]|nr:DUF2779 domain-containing protein [Planctomycetota bacterium]
MARHILSKSTFIRGIQCHKSLFLNRYHKELRDTLSPEQEALFSRGTDVGIFAQQLFPGGVDASPENYYDFSPSLKKTKQLMSRGTDVIYEAAFHHDGLLAAIDIFVKDNTRWKIYEVKSATSISDTHILDASYQYYVATQSGIAISDISLVHINTEYVRHGPIDIASLFTIVSVLKEAREKQNFVRETIFLLKTVLKNKSLPAIDIGEHCDSPYPCDFKGYCWQHIPENSIFDISGLYSKKKFELYNKGIVALQDIPDDYDLSPSQHIQVKCALNNEKHIKNDEMKRFLQDITYPLYFLDFETFQPAIPLFENTRPYQRIVFQYSLHYKETEYATLLHFEFLGDGKTDPRRPLIEKLLPDTKTPGAILVYNKAFECTIMKELAESFPEYSGEITERLSRIKDLMIPFQKKYYYTPEMKGSYSIKYVLPALIPNPPERYEDLEICNGDIAMNAYESLNTESNPQKRERTRHALLRYCRLDTLAMIWILEIMEKCGMK